MLKVKNLHQIDGKTTVVEVRNKTQHDLLKKIYPKMSSFDKQYCYYIVDDYNYGRGDKDSYNDNRYTILKIEDIFEPANFIYKLKEDLWVNECRKKSFLKGVCSIGLIHLEHPTVNEINKVLSQNIPDVIDNFKKAGVLDTWFDKITEEFEVGQWVISMIADEPKPDLIISKTKTHYKTLDSIFDESVVGFNKNHPLRLATLEEIENCQFNYNINDFDIILNNDLKIIQIDKLKL